MPNLLTLEPPAHADRLPHYQDLRDVLPIVPPGNPPNSERGPLYVLPTHDSAGRLCRAEIYAHGYGPDDHGDGRLVVIVTWRRGLASGIVDNGRDQWSLPDQFWINDIIRSAPDYESIDQFTREINQTCEQIDATEPPLATL